MKKTNTKEKNYFKCKNSDEIISIMEKSEKEHRNAMRDAIEIEVTIMQNIKKQD